MNRFEGKWKWAVPNKGEIIGKQKMCMHLRKVMEKRHMECDVNYFSLHF